MNNLFNQMIGKRFAVHKYLVSNGYYYSATQLLAAMIKKNYKEIYKICKCWGHNV